MKSAEDLQALVISQQRTIAQLTATVAQLTAALLAEDDGDEPVGTGYLSNRGGVS